MSEAEVLSGYKCIQVVPAAAKVVGEMDAYEDTLGFHLTAFTAEMLAAGESSTFVVEAERVQVVKQAGQVWVAGEPIYWSESTSDFTNVPGTGTKLVGKAVQAATNASVIGFVLFSDMSPIQRGLELGTVASPLPIVASDPMLSVDVTSAAIAGNVMAIDNSLVITAASAVNTIEAFRFVLESNVTLGNWANTVFAKLDLKDNGQVTGLASVVCAEINLPSTVVPSGGSYQVIEAEINCPTGCSMNGRPIDIVGINVWGAAAAQFDTVGNLFNITGVTSGAGKFWYANAVAFNNCDAFLKIKVLGTTYYIPVSDNQAGT